MKKATQLDDALDDAQNNLKRAASYNKLTRDYDEQKQTVLELDVQKEHLVTQCGIAKRILNDYKSIIDELEMDKRRLMDGKERLTNENNNLIQERNKLIDTIKELDKGMVDEMAKGKPPKGYSKQQIDLAYLLGVLNVSGIDGMHEEIQRLMELEKEPHDIFNNHP